MRRIFFFILPILIIVAAGFTVFGIVQVRIDEEKLMDELKYKARAVAESMELSVRVALENHNSVNAEYLVEKFQTRDRLQGCVIYDANGRIVAITQRFADWKDKDKPYIQTVLKSKVSFSDIEKFKDYTVYSYVLPVVKDDGTVLGVVEIIYDTSYVLGRLGEIWKSISVTLIVLFVLIVVSSVIVFRQMFFLPVVKLTDWFKNFLKGEGDHRHPLSDKDELGKLANEVEQVALNLRVARRAIVEDAQMKLNKDEVWTENRLRSFIQAKLGASSMLVVSNREPYMHMADEATGKVRCIRPASGVVTAIGPILQALGGTWIAHGAGNADRKHVNSKDKIGVPPEDNRYILRRVWLTKDEEEEYYYGFSNEGLWPLCHITHTRPIFNDKDWDTYQKVNQKFADAVIEELPAGPAFVFIQDYHFMLLPSMIKARRPDVIVALFWHIPWPNPEVFSVCPYQKQILNGMLACDLIGFHVQYHCNNFLETANRLLECRVDTEKFSIVRGEQETLVRAFPISIALPGADDVISEKELAKVRNEYKLNDKIVAVGVDRIDYTKGIGERILAIDRFLEKHPEFKKKFVFVQIGAPSRTHIKRYHDLGGEIDELVEKVNWKHSDGDYKPIIYIKRHLSAEEILPFYTLSDICIVSSLHDGMNLVAKEYVAHRHDESGVLLLSCFTGAIREFTEAVAINPYATEEFAEAIFMAVTMPRDEQKRRMASMRKTIRENNVYRWAGSIVAELSGLRKSGHEKPTV
ncbi:MAG: trehalose-6-phosphate synthase [Candidatus Omnitrophota bacterium]